MLSGALRYCCIFYLLSFAVFCSPKMVSAAPFTLSGSWDYLESGGDLEDSWTFLQSYSLTGSKNLSASSDVSASFRYNKSDRQDGDDSRVMSPNASLELRNDLFSLNLNGTQTQSESGGNPELTSRAWDVTAYSLFEKWPRLRLNYGQSTIADDQSPHAQDSDTDYFSASLDYAWSKFKLFYDYRLDSSTNNVTSSTTDSGRHFAKIEYADNFFDGKLAVNAAQQYSTSDSETESQVATGGTLFIPVGLSQTLVAQDDTPLTGSLSANGALNDGDTATATLVEIAEVAVDQNLGMQTDFQPVNQLRVYLDREMTLGNQSQLSWSIYSSSDNLDWDLISNAPAVSYDVEAGRTVVFVDIPGSDLLERYVKLVVSSTGLVTEPTFVTELAAGRTIIATGNQVVDKSSFESYQTRIGISYSPTMKWSFAYNMTWVKNDPNPGLEGKQLTHGLSARFMPEPGLSFSAAINENRDEVEAREDRLDRVYSFSAEKQFWETMHLSVGYSHSESLEDSTRNSESDSVNGFLNAQLFPDLRASMNLNWTRSEDFQDEGGKSENYGVRLDSTAQLTPRINAIAFYDFGSSKSDNEENETETDNNTYGLTLNFRTSDVLSFYAGLRRDAEANTTDFNGSASWRITPKIQTSFSTSQDLERGDSESYSGSLNWLVSSHFSLRANGGYQVSKDVESWSWRLSGNATF